MNFDLPPDAGPDGKFGDLAPSVDPDDLRSVFNIMKNSNANSAIGIRVFEDVCNPGADVQAVCYRAAMLQLLSRHACLAPWIRDGEFDDVLLKVFARFPLKKLQVSFIHQGFPLDVEELVKQIGEEAPR